MAAVFDGQTKVGRAVADPNTDQTLPNPGSMIFPAVATPAGIAGTVGADCKLVHGDCWKHVSGSIMEMIDTNVTTMIMGNEIRQVTGTQTLTSIGNVTRTSISNVVETVVGSAIRTNIGAVAHNFISNHVATHCSPQNKFEPGVFMHAVFDHLKMGQSYTLSYLLYVQFYIQYFSLTPTYTNLIPGLNLSWISINIHGEGFDNATRAMNNTIRGLKSDIGALKGKIEGMHAGTPVSITAIYLAVNCYVM